MVFRHFIGVFARKEHPLALFLDDLQSVDIATLDLIEHLVTHSKAPRLLLVAAYRDNEVGPAHPLPDARCNPRPPASECVKSCWRRFSIDDVGQLVADALHCEPRTARPLARLVHEKTGGNPFFAIQFVTALADEGLLSFGFIASAWQWDIDRIRAKGYSDNVVDLMVGKLKRFSTTTQEAVKQLACLGNVGEIAILAMVHGTTEAALHPALWEAVQAGFVLREDGAYKFLHDRIQQAAYSLILVRAPCRHPPAHGPCDAGEHVGGRARRASVRCRQSTKSGRWAANRPGRESAGGDDQPACGAKGQGVSGLCVGERVSDGRHGGARRQRLGQPVRTHVQPVARRAECAFLTGDFDQAERLYRGYFNAGRRSLTSRPSTTQSAASYREVGKSPSPGQRTHVSAPVRR